MTKKYIIKGAIYRMKKKVMSILLVAGMVLSTGVLAHASQGPTVGGQSGKGTSYTGFVRGDTSSYGANAETYTFRQSGTENVYAYVEIVNSQGYKIGSGQEGTGTTSAYSGVITRGGGVNAYGSCGTATGSSRAFAHLY